MGISLTGSLTALGFGYAVKTWKKYKLEESLKKYPIETAELVKINLKDDLQVIFGNFKTNDFSKDSKKVLVARLMFGEAEGCSDKEKIAVAHVALNRAKDGKKWNGETLRESILKPYQFSCFNKGLDRRVRDPMKHNAKDFQQCLILAEEFLENKYSDPTNGATFYYNPNLVNPSWAKKLNRVEVPGTIHWFFKEK